MSGRSIFDPDVVAGPCRYPCTDWRHVHDEDLPANAGAMQDYDPERLPPFLRSDPTEVME